MNSIELKNIHFKVNNQPILEDASLFVEKNETLAVTGKNGSGKSTLLKIIAGLVPPSKGKVDRYTQKIGYVPEQPPKSLRFTPIEYLRYMGQMAGVKGELLESRIKELISQFGLEDYKHTFIQHLSKGNQQKVTIMQALLPNPEMILLDEPLSGLDSRSQKELIKILIELKKAGITIIFTSHETYLKEKIADRIVTIDERHIKDVIEADADVHYRVIELSGKSTIFLPFIQKSATIVSHVCPSDTTYKITVFSTKSDEIINQILKLGGSIQFVSHQSSEPPKLEQNKIY